MITLEKARQLPVPQECRDNPNLFYLTSMLNSCRHPRKVYEAMKVVFSSVKPDAKEAAV